METVTLDELLKYLSQMKLVAHRLGYGMTDHPENSLEALKEIFAKSELLNSCDGFEFDICFTKDNIPVVIHDKYIDDVSDGYGLVSDYTLAQLKEYTFNFRHSLKKSENCSFKIVSLEELLSFFSDNYMLLGAKIIKIETKEACCFSDKNLVVLDEIISKFPGLSKNIVHLSFWPLNLIKLRNIQRANMHYESKTDLLCDFNAMVNFSRYITCLDAISLRVRTKTEANILADNSNRVNSRIAFEKLCMQISYAANQGNIEYAIEKFGEVGLYVINNIKDLEVLSKILERAFFIKNHQAMTITTNNPHHLSSLCGRKS